MPPVQCCCYKKIIYHKRDVFWHRRNIETGGGGRGEYLSVKNAYCLYNVLETKLSHSIMVKIQYLPETMGQIVKRLNTANVQFPPCPLFNVAAIKKRHGEARETLQNLCINSFEHALLGC